MKLRLPFPPRLWLACLMAASALATPALGDFIASSGNDKPASVRFEFDATDDTGNTTFFRRGTGAYRHVGQAFTLAVPTFSLTSVSFKTWEVAAETRGRKCSIKLYRVTSPSSAPDPVDDLLFTQSGLMPEQVDPQQYLTFTFDTPYTLEEGASYLLMLGFDEPTSSGNQVKAVGLERTNGNAKVGRLWVYNGERFASDRKTLLFYLHGTEAP